MDENYSQIIPNPKAAFLTGRDKFIEIIKEMCKKFELSDRTFFLAICYMDDLLSHLAFPKSRLHLAILCCLLLAGIFYEFHNKN